MSDMTPLAEIAQRYFDQQLADSPLRATYYGIPGYDHLLPDPNREADRRRRAHLTDLGEELTGIDADALEGQDRITHSMLTRLVRDEIGSIDGAVHEVGVSASIVGTVPGMLAGLPRVKLTNEQHSADYLKRLAGLGDYFDAALERHRQAAADGRHQTRHGIESAVAQIDDYLAGPLSEDPLLQPTPAEVDAEAWLAEAGALVSERVRPSLVRWRETLTAEFAPAARPDDQVGVCHVPGGEAAYRSAAAQFTTTDLTPEQIHQIGLDAVDLLREEFAEIGAEALGTSDTDEVIARLRDDESLRYDSAEQIVEDVTTALRRAEAALPDWFRPYDIAPCEVEVIPAATAKNATLAYYTVPAVDGSRPGTHWVNTFEPSSRARFEYEALAFHESVPGHHLQFALGQVLKGLPQFRGHGYVTAFGEGWGLYTERLCDEMELYSSPLTRLGMVSFDAWRACRLVVDTGMHAFGWSRDRAVAFMHENTALSDVNIANEVDRYIAWPGQALAYMIGRRHIGQLRERAERELGAAFDIREFHHRVLSNGSIPLETMTGAIEDWIAESR